MAYGEEVTTSNDSGKLSYCFYRTGDFVATTYGASILNSKSGSCYNALPADLKSVIKTRSEFYTTYGKSGATSTQITLSAKLWLFDVSEVCPALNQGAYPFFNNSNHFSLTYNYWTRTPADSTNSDGKFYYMKAGSLNARETDTGNKNYAVVFGFYIG